MPERDQAAGFSGCFNMLKHSFTLILQHWGPKRVIFLSTALLYLQDKSYRKVKGDLMKS